MPSLLSRTSIVLALFGALGVGACKKEPSAGTETPGSGGASASGGTSLAYKVAPLKLKEIVTVSVSSTGKTGAGGLKVDATGLLDVSDAGGGKLKVGYSVVEVRALEMTGQMKPKPKEGAPEPDYKAQLLTGKGARIIDLTGDEDDQATEALPENAKKPKQEGKEPELDISQFASFLGLPSGFPAQGLVEGTPLKVKKEKVEKLANFDIDMEVDLVYTLVKIDASSGKRLAELKIEAEASGARELSQGGKSINISLNTTTESTIVWNLDDHLPVSSHLEATQAGDFGEYGSGETQFVIDAKYEPTT